MDQLITERCNSQMMSLSASRMLAVVGEHLFPFPDLPQSEGSRSGDIKPIPWASDCFLVTDLTTSHIVETLICNWNTRKLGLLQSHAQNQFATVVHPGPGCTKETMICIHKNSLLTVTSIVVIHLLLVTTNTSFVVNKIPQALSNNLMDIIRYIPCTHVLSHKYLTDSLLGGEVFTVILVLNGPVIPALVII